VSAPRTWSAGPPRTSSRLSSKPKRRRRVDLGSAVAVPQPLRGEMTKVAIGLVDYLGLYREAGFR
jgi:hypothetical protein